MKVINKDLKELIPYENNPRKNKKAIELVANSISEFGFKQPIVVDKDMVIVAGHTRYEAAKKLKLLAVPVVVAEELTDDQIRAYRLADNKTGEAAEWDFDKLVVEIDEIEMDLTQFGFDIVEEDPQEIEEDEVPGVAEEPVIFPGDLIELGGHRLMCGDSTISTDVGCLMDGVLADMFLTDPPYNVAYEGKTKDQLKIKNDEMKDADFRQFLKDAFISADSVMKPGAVFYIWHADSEGYNFRGACGDIMWKVRQCLIWVKNSLVMGRQDYHWKHEPCLYGWKDGAAHLWAADRKQTTILSFDRPTVSKEHPTMKPVALFAYQVLNNTKGQDIVLDLFGGSGTTLIACEQLNRKCYTMELDPKYCQVIVQRYVNFKQSQDVVINGKAVKWEEFKNSKGG